jgi:glucose-fructose oxidoreductase
MPQKIRYAVAGQGYISQIAVLPAFENASKNSELAALISDDPAKLKKLARKYDVPRTYHYEQYDECLRSGEIDAVYIALPNHMHHEYTIRAAKAGIHVLCEKPMAMTAREAEEMIEACRSAKVKLMIAYRLHFEKANLKALEIVRSGRLGEPRFFNSSFSMQVKDGNVRLSKRRGGGTLYDIGIYCINAARSIFESEPERVSAVQLSGADDRFSEVEEMVGAQMVFPGSRLASFVCSFGAADVSSYRIVGTKGSLRVDDAYEFESEIRHTLTEGERTKEKEYPKRDQFAPELLYFSRCIQNDEEPEPGGAEGLADMKVIEALYASAEKGRPVELGDPVRVAHPKPDQEISRPSIRRPALVHAATPSRH